MFSANSSQVSDDKLFVEDVFSTYLYTGNGGTQTITNGIDLAGNGGMLWIKNRSSATHNIISDTVRGAGNFLMSNSTSQQFFNTDNVSALSSTGFSVGVDSNTNGTAGNLYASWTFREAPKFFDVVTYTGDGTNNRSIAHSLGVAPGMIIIKQTSGTSNWRCYNRALSNPDNMSINLNGTQAASDYGFALWSTSSTNFSVNQSLFALNSSGQTYVAYLFAHDPTSDGVIQCGGYTVPAGATSYDVNIGWEPQWMLVKRANGGGGWTILDNMRGWPQSPSVGAGLSANTADAEFNTAKPDITSTGFSVNDFSSFGTPGNTFIYMAIRRGPMRTPTLGTSVYNAVARTGTGATATVNANMTVDLSITSLSGGYSGLDHVVFDRLRGAGRYSATNTSAAEDTFPSDLLTSFATQNGVILGADADPDFNGKINASGFTYINWYFRRAPGFFDEVCYTGTGANLTVNHNLGVTPELIFIKNRSGAWGWDVEASFTSSGYSRGALNTNARFFPQTYPDTIVSQPTATQFVVSNNIYVGSSGNNYVAYLFASCPGVSKVGTYTGNGSSQTINCGFAAGARFVMIKRTDSTGDWYVWDSARGIVAANDPRLSLNTTAAEVTTDDSVDTDSSGFVVNQVAATNVNVNAATYIYLAIA